MKSAIVVLGFAATTLGVRLEPVRPTAGAGLWFEPNTGQVKGRTEFIGRTRGAYLYMTDAEVVFEMAPAKVEPGAKMRQVRMSFVGAAAKPSSRPEQPTGGHSNYFVGKTEKEWFTAIPHYERLRYRDVYPGIDVVYYGTEGRIEYDFEVKPGADVSKIGIRFSEPVSLDPSGDLLAGGIRQHKPRVLQAGAEIESWYEIEGGVARVRMANYDPAAGLTIDPVIEFSGYIGGPGEDEVVSIAALPDGNVVLAGFTQSPSSPTLDPFQQPSIVSAASFLLKMSADGKRVFGFTVLGTNGWDTAYKVVVGPDGTIHVAGTTQSTSFPLKNAAQSENRSVWGTIYVTHLTADMKTLLFSTYWGGSNKEVPGSIAVDAAGNIYLVGQTSSNDFPLRRGLQERFGSGIDAIVAKFRPNGQVEFSSYLGGAGFQQFLGVAIRRDGDIVIVGISNTSEFPWVDAVRTEGDTGYGALVLVRMTPDGSSIRYASFIAGGVAANPVRELILDAGDNIYLAGSVYRPGFPLKDPLHSEMGERGTGFLMKLDPSGKTLLQSTLLPDVWVQGFARDADGNVILSGAAFGPGAILKDSPQQFRGGGITNTDGWVMKLAPDLKTVIYGVLQAGANFDWLECVTAGANGAVFLGGHTASIDFPSKNAFQPKSGGSNDGLFMKIVDNSRPLVPSFTLAPARLNLTFTQGSATLPAAQTIALNGLSQAAAITSDSAWLRVTPGSLASSGTFAVSVAPAGLAPGVYRGVVRIAPASGAAAILDVTLAVLAAAPILRELSPALTPIGSDDTVITVRGEGFTRSTLLFVNTIPWTLSPVEFVDSGTLRFRLPKSYFSIEYNHSIAVQNPDSAQSQALNLAVGKPAPQIARNGVVNAASYESTVFSAGLMVTLFGTEFGTAETARVLFDYLPVKAIYYLPNQIAAVIPAELAGARSVTVMVERGDQRSAPVVLSMVASTPALFTADSSGKGLAAALNQDGSVNSPANPAAKGSIVVLYGTGGGVESLPTKVFIDGMECEVLYAGAAPGLVAGAWQLNVRIPDYASKGSVVWRAGERESPVGVFVSLGGE